MYLSEIEIKNFRVLKNLKTSFQPGLNIILGENNTGKTALIDAIRIILGVGSYRKDIYIQDDDLYHDEYGREYAESCEIHAKLSGLTRAEAGLYSLCLSPSMGEGIAEIHLKFESERARGRRRSNSTVWGGETEGESLPYEALHGIKTVYLEALRDAQRGLTPGRGSRVAQLIQALSVEESQREDLERIVTTANEEVLQHNLIKNARDIINQGLTDITGEYMSQKSDLALSEPEFRRITESIKAIIGKHKTFEIGENGLGYNNLLYIATVLGELQCLEEIDLAVLLIEEPEAHLHPQLQSVLVSYLQKVSREQLISKKTCNPVQIFLTSHSPIVASRVDLSAMNIFYYANGSIKSNSSVSVNLDDREISYLQRYLDVTRSQLFFAKGVIFVEGISEAILIPELAKTIGFDLEKLGVLIVNVQSKYFTPFAKLYNNSNYAVPSVLITDSDPEEGLFPTHYDDIIVSPGSRMIKGLEGGSLKVFLSAKTFEYDLALYGNALYMAEVYRTIHPQKAESMKTRIHVSMSNQQKAQVFYEEFDKNEKARFAQILADNLDMAQPSFNLPVYIANAIRYVCEWQLNEQAI